MSKTYIAPIGHGLGDLIVSLPAVQWLIERGEETHLVLRSPRQEGFERLIPGLAGFVKEVELASALTSGDRYINLREHPLQTDHVWGSIEFDLKYPGYRIADIVRDISHDYGIKADFENLVPLPFKRIPEAAGKILFVPGSDGEFKCWLAERWMELKRRLEAEGHSIAMLGQPNKSKAVFELLELGIPWIETATFKDCIDAVSSARSVVSIDTGLMHLALQQNVPVAAIWINNPGSLNYVRTVSHCFPVISPKCAPDCISEELDKNLNLVTEFKEWCEYDGWNCHASFQTRCMNRVSVDEVYSQVRKALDSASLGINK